jgi:hypothetical protein
MQSKIPYHYLTEKGILKRVKPRFFAGMRYIKHGIVVDRGYEQLYPIHINHLDSNGSIVRYYWSGSTNDTTSPSVRKTATDTILRNFGANDIAMPHNVIPYWIFARDDDGLIDSGYPNRKFYVYADSVPPPPDIIAVTSGDSVKIEWAGKDTRDGNATRYQLQVRLASTATYTIAKDWTAGSAFTAADVVGYDFRTSFKGGTHSAAYKYKVLAKDVQGSINTSIEGSFVFP